MSEFQIFDKIGNLRAFTSDELESLPADRRKLLDAVIAAATDAKQCEEMIAAAQRSLTECDQVMAAVQANLKRAAPSRIQAAREWMNSTRGL